jgi:cytochrome c oxidase cbb3-type subunit 3
MSSEKDNVDPHSGVETTGHSWDGIQELNNPLPRWWLYVWYITIVISIVYMVLMPAIPALPGMGTNTTGLRNQSDRDNVAIEMGKLDAARQVKAEDLLKASLQDIEQDRDLQQFSLAMGESLFESNCATCHGTGGRGAKGYPVLADDIWLWDGTLSGIETTLHHGIRHTSDELTRNSAMPRFGRDKLLTSAEIDDLVQYVLNFSGRSDSQAAVQRGQSLFASQCAVCHGDGGKGNRTIGAPNLTDEDWLYGGEEADIYTTIFNARNSHMPAWTDRLDDASIKALAVYVHSLGGGE